MKRQNDKLHFVAQTVKQIGYPRWDKAIAISKTDASVNGRGQTGDSANIYYVPFVRDSENFVNASLLISTELNDTTFEYKCNWQYKNFTYGTPHQDSTAERYALFFLIMDYRTFGYTQFKITDTNLFYNNHPYNGNGRRIGLTISNQGGKGYSAYVENLEVCAYYYHCGTPDAAVCNDADGCDFLDCPTGECTLSDVEFCDDSWPVGGGGGGGGAGNSGGNGGGTGGSGGTGGGSGGGGGGTPPECGGTLRAIAGRTNVVDPCGPGWVPDYGDGENYPPSPTNDSTIAENLKRLMQKANNIPDSLYNIAQQDGNERTFSFTVNGTDTAVMYIKNGTTHSSSPTLTSSTIAIFHTHQEDDTTGGSDRNQCFDGPDIYKLYKNVAIDGYQIAVSIISTRDYYYAAVITDKYKFRDYIRTICGTQNLNQINYRLNEIHIDAMDLCVPPPVCNWERKTELGALAITANNDATVSGIKIFKSNKQSINFTLLIP